MQIRLYQINPDRDQNRVMHEPLDNLLNCPLVFLLLRFSSINRKNNYVS